MYYVQENDMDMDVCMRVEAWASQARARYQFICFHMRSRVDFSNGVLCAMCERHNDTRTHHVWSAIA